MLAALDCQWCGATFAASRADALYCSTSHRVQASRSRRGNAAALAAFDTAHQTVRRTLRSQDTREAPLVAVTALVDAALADVRRSLHLPHSPARRGPTA